MVSSRQGTLPLGQARSLWRPAASRGLNFRIARHRSTILIEGSLCLVLFRPQSEEGGADYRVGQQFRSQ